MKAILVGTDGSDTSMGAVQQAAELAGQTGATLHIACVVNLARDVAAASLGSFVIPEGFDDQAQAAGQAAITRASEIAGQYTPNVQGHVLQGDIAASLMALAENIPVDILVVGSKGMTGAARFLLGSVPNRCAHHAPCSVLIVRTQ
jgi:nucleotide-binding universal stress UspA family protein